MKIENNIYRHRYTYIMKYNKIFILYLFIFLFILPYVSSAQESLGTFKQNSDVLLTQLCGDCTYVNITSVTYPNSSEAITNVAMTKSGSKFTYTLSKNFTKQIGVYNVNGVGNIGGVPTVFAYTLTITGSGEKTDTGQAVVLVGLIILSVLLFGIGWSFNPEKWKIKTAFYIFALFIGLIFLNSAKVISSSSGIVYIMMNSAFYLGIALTLFMMAYLFIYSFIDIIEDLKRKRFQRWA